MNGWSRELKFLDTYNKEVVLAKSVADIRKARADGRIAHVYGWQSADALGAAFNGTMGGVDTPLRAFYEMGLRSVGIAYNVANVFGGGCLEPTTPLSRAGKRLVEEMHKMRIVLDVGGHTGEQTSLDAIAITSGLPVVCSHTNVAAIADNPRCISDRLIDAIAGTGGVIGLTAVNDFHVRSRRDADVKSSPGSAWTSTSNSSTTSGNGSASTTSGSAPTSWTACRWCTKRSIAKSSPGR
jgi:membrane dipeptidase